MEYRQLGASGLFVPELTFGTATFGGGNDFFPATFSNTTLEKADFSTARNFSIQPEFNKMKKAKFSAMNLAGLLDRYQLDISNNH